VKKFKDHIKNDAKEILAVQAILNKIAIEGDIFVENPTGRVTRVPKTLQGAMVKPSYPWVYVFKTILDGRTEYRPEWVIVYDAYRFGDGRTYYRVKHAYPVTSDSDPQGKFMIVGLK